MKAPAASLAPRAARVLLALLLLISAPAFAAEEDKDLDLIPPAAEAPPPAVLPVPASNAAQRNYLEDAFTFTPLRDSLVVPLSSADPGKLGRPSVLRFARRVEPWQQRHAGLQRPLQPARR